MARDETDVDPSKWGEKLTSLPQIIADRNIGFKLIYGVCKDTGKDASGINTCQVTESIDWSDNSGQNYYWFSDISECINMVVKMNKETPADIALSKDDALMAACVPAPKEKGNGVNGYEMVFTLYPLGGYKETYARLREKRSSSATIFKTFRSCYDSVDGAIAITLKSLGADKEGRLPPDKSDFLNLTATCSRVYSSEASKSTSQLPGTAKEQRKDLPQVGTFATIKYGWPGCKDEYVFNELNLISHSGDTDAFLKFMVDKRGTGECMPLPAGMKVQIEALGQGQEEPPHICVRPEGHGECFWVKVDHISAILPKAHKRGS